MREKALILGKRILQHELINGSALIFAGTMISNVFAFMFNIFLVRSLSYAEYGEYIALISIITLAGIPAQSLLPVLVQYSSRFFNKKDGASLNEFYFQANRLLLLIGIGLTAFFIVSTPLLQHFFHISVTSIIILSGIVSGFAYIAVPNTAFLQGLLRFDFLAGTSALGGLLKFLSGVFFIFLGWKTFGALGAVFVSFLIPFMLSYLPLASHISFKRTKKVKIPVREILQYALPAMLSVFCLSAFTSTDLLLVKHFFNGHDAGLYGGLALIGRIIFYFTAPISTVMFPLVIKRYEEKRSFQMLFYLALLLVLLPSMLLIFIYFLFPHLIISIFLGGKGYQVVSQYLGVYGIFLCLFSIMNVMVNFFLSLKKTKVVLLLIFGSILQVFLIIIFHNTFWQVIYSSIAVVLAVFALLIGYYVKSGYLLSSQQQ